MAVTRWYEQQLPNARKDSVDSGDLKYRFWEQDGQRAMVLSQNLEGGGLYLGTAMGDNRVMDALGMTAESARHDGKVVLRILAERKKAASAGKAKP